MGHGSNASGIMKGAVIIPVCCKKKRAAIAATTFTFPLH